MLSVMFVFSCMLNGTLFAAVSALMGSSSRAPGCDGVASAASTSFFGIRTKSAILFASKVCLIKMLVHNL